MTRIECSANLIRFKYNLSVLRNMVSCDKCNGECCRYITVSYQEPKNEEDWDEIKWMLLHDGVMVYKDNSNEWNVEVRTKCKFLGKDNKCKIYDKRPAVCKNHKLHECEANNEEFAKVIFNEPEDVDNFLKEE